MKISLILCISVILFFSCSAPAEKEETISIPDTIQTESGLKYYYLKKGEGRKVVRNSTLSAYLSLKVEDSVVWTTDESPDSVFTFIVGVDGVIKGFEEMALLMREGDDVVAILPDTLAYGSRGAGDVIPPNATLVYDRFDVRSVSEPKSILRDSLVAALDLGMEFMKAKYDDITTSSDSSLYYLGETEVRRFWSFLRSDDQYEDALQVLEYFKTVAPWEGIEWSRVLSLEDVGRINEAIEELRGVIASDTSGWTGYGEKLGNLQDKLEEK